jgi:hypothetical protein
MARDFHPRAQGDLGEAAAIAWLTKIGAGVSVPLFHSPDYDLIAEFERRLLRVQVKTSGYRRNNRFCIALATRGGNQSWSGLVKHFDPSRCDFLFALVASGQRWFIPSHAVEGQTGIMLGGPKYSEFEVDSAGAAAFRIDPASRIDARRGSADVGESGETVNLVPLAEWVRIPPPPSAKPAAAISIRLRNNARTRISAGHQITIPSGPFRAAGFAAGDRLLVEATGPGEATVKRIEPSAQLDLSEPVPA